MCISMKKSTASVQLFAGRAYVNFFYYYFEGSGEPKKHIFIFNEEIFPVFNCVLLIDWSAMLIICLLNPKRFFLFCFVLFCFLLLSNFNFFFLFCFVLFFVVVRPGFSQKKKKKKKKKPKAYIYHMRSFKENELSSISTKMNQKL